MFNKISQIIASIISTLIIICIIIVIILWIIYYVNPKKCSKLYNDKWYLKSEIKPWEISTQENFPFQMIENDYDYWKNFVIDLESLSKYKLKEMDNDNPIKKAFREFLFPNSQSSNKNISFDYRELCWKENGIIEIVSQNHITVDTKWMRSNLISKVSFLFINSKSNFYVQDVAGCLIYGLLLVGKEIQLSHNDKKEILKNNGKGFIFRSDIEIQLESGSKLLLIHFLPKGKTSWDKLNIPLSKIMQATDKLKNSK